MIKTVRTIDLDRDAATRSIIGRGRADVVAVVEPLTGWRDTHMVIVDWPDTGATTYAHATLTDTEAASLPTVRTARELVRLR